METVITILEKTTLANSDIVSLGQEYIPPVRGGGKRGLKKLWDKRSLIEFAISGHILKHCTSIINTGEIILAVRKTYEWNHIFDDAGNIIVENLPKKHKVFLHIRDSNISTIAIFLDEKEHLADLKKNWQSVYFVDLTEDFKKALK